MRVINYSFTHKVHGEEVIAQSSPFSVDGVSFPLQKKIDICDSDLIHTNCPVWSHKESRTFLVRSPIEYEFECVKDKLDYGLKWADKNKLPFNQVMHLDGGWDNTDTPILQVQHPTLAFWTEDKNIWIEIKPHPLTVEKNFLAIGGWFNLSNWRRSTSFGMQVLNLNTPVRVKRGDILFEVCFYSDNLDDQYKLVQHDRIPDDEYRKMMNTANVKSYIANFTKGLFKKQEESKCPFAFLFNK